MYKIIVLLNNLYYLFVKIYTYFVHYSNKLYNNLYLTMNDNSCKKNLLYVKNTSEFNDNNVIFEYDFIIYKYFLEDIETITIISKNDFNNMDKIELYKKYIPKISNYKFILIKIIFNEYSYDITDIIKNKNNYFYVENNKLFDKYFMNWFCKKYLNINYDSSMYIELFDNLMNKHIIYSSNYIILEKNNFKLI
jgi:hypothetical protein